MIYDLLLVDPRRPDALAASLAAVLDVPVGEVDVGHEDGDADDRNWDALVLCTYGEPRGDLSLVLSIYTRDEVPCQAEERGFASLLAAEVRTAVLFSAEGLRPSAYWVATPDGVVARARLHESDDDPPSLHVDTVEAPVPQLPRTPVARIPEVVGDLPVATPVTDALREHPADIAYTVPLSDKPWPREWDALDALGAWEMLVRMMEADWEPAGWCPADLYQWRLEARDQIADHAPHLPEPAAALLLSALSEVDDVFAAATVDDPGHVLVRELAGRDGDRVERGWWWYRRPEPLPWREAEACVQPMGGRPDTD
ncbi:hypothetical protein ABZ883_40855 [Streptomyces sp. NPDC046977]|uniref:hypothetical protein n=1 Tax=Streptomyces sp. NPDC046977 TaxID=3154703 RepID=UPI0033C08D41